MQYWLDTSLGEWGIVKNQGSDGVESTVDPPATWFRKTQHDPLVMEREEFQRLYETLERLSITPVYSPVFPAPKN